MAQAVVPAMQCQVGVRGKSAVPARQPAGRVWGVRRTARATSGFKVLALGPETTGVIQRMQQLLDMDTTPFTDKIIAEYIWYARIRPRNVARRSFLVTRIHRASGLCSLPWIDGLTSMRAQHSSATAVVAAWDMPNLHFQGITPD